VTPRLESFPSKARFMTAQEQYNAAGIRLRFR
jgi:hypothetical protein